MDALRKHFPWMTAEEEVWLRAELMRRAAVRFEQAELWSEAAECWADLGEAGRAGELYARSGDLRRAGAALLAAGRYAEALTWFQSWAGRLPETEWAGRIAALLGQAACHLLATGPGAAQPDGGPLEARLGRDRYRQARALLADGAAGDPLEVARGWVALAEYGRHMARPDLVQEGYEQALAHFEATAAAAEKIETACAYLAASREAGDHLLGQAIESRLAAWRAWAAPPEPTWQQQRRTIEGHPFRERVRDVLHFTHPEQWAAWQKLAELEDRPEVDDYLRSLAPPEMIYIPPGSFLMGSADDDLDARDNEKPQHEIWLRGYYIDRYPVTNDEFRKFIEAGGYRTEAYWVEARAAGRWTDGKYNDYFSGERDRPEYWKNDQFNGPEQPVVGISWYEAVAYARWVGKYLPSETQWEKAAGWDPVHRQKRKYPWGDEWDADKSNSGGKHDRTTAVGHYPEDRSPYGLLDVAGNVDEWCSTRWRDENGQEYRYPFDGQDGREELSGGDDVWRVIKGAGWSGSSDNARNWARCGFRLGDIPRFGFSGWGYRCVTPHAFFPPVLSSEF